MLPVFMDDANRLRELKQQRDRAYKSYLKAKKVFDDAADAAMARAAPAFEQEEWFRREAAREKALERESRSRIRDDV